MWILCIGCYRFIASDSWGIKQSVVSGYEMVASGAITIAPDLRTVPGELSKCLSPFFFNISYADFQPSAIQLARPIWRIFSNLFLSKTVLHYSLHLAQSLYIAPLYTEDSERVKLLLRQSCRPLPFVFNNYSVSCNHSSSKGKGWGYTWLLQFSIYPSWLNDHALREQWNYAFAYTAQETISICRWCPEEDSLP